MIKCGDGDKFGVLSYAYTNWATEDGSYSPKTMNIGDYIQSLAARQFLPRVDAFIDRDHLAHYDGEKVKMIMNGWYSIWEGNRAFSKDIDPLMVSIHIYNVDKLKEETIAYFKRHEPIGCRDLNTMRGLKARGVEAYFSGCLTLTLGKTYHANPDERGNKILFVDHKLGKDVRIAQSLNEILKRYEGCEYETLTKHYPIIDDHNACLQEAENLLRKYAHAKLVVTENIHCALPCLAIGTPVIFIARKFDERRYHGLWDFFNVIGYDSSCRFEERILFDKTGMVMNPSTHVPYAEELKKKCTAFIGKDSHFTGLNQGQSLLCQQAQSISFDGGENMLNAAITQFSGSQVRCAKMLIRDRLIKKNMPTKPVRHVALYYPRMTIGGIERVLQQEISTLIQLGVKVTLLLEEPFTNQCYEIPEEVEIVYLPQVTSTGAVSVLERCKKLTQELARRDVDVFHSHAYFSSVILWDLLVCKWRLGIPFVLHYHNMFTYSLHARTTPSQFSAKLNVLKCVDRVVALSRVDAAFFNANKIPAIYLQNPIDRKLVDLWEEDLSGEKDPNMVLWIGRISREKRPAEAIKIFSELYKMRPESRLVMAGGGKDDIVKEVTELIDELGLKDAVTLEGAQLDAYKYYRKASVLLATSSFEGFPMVITEALCAGLPVVAYKIPHLELYRDNPAVVQVEQGDCLSAAVGLKNLLNSPDLKGKSQQAKKFVEKFIKYNFKAGLWNVLGNWEPGEENVGKSISAHIPFEDFALCIDAIISGMSATHEQGIGEKVGLNKEVRVDRLQSELDAVRQKVEVARAERDAARKKAQNFVAEKRKRRAAEKSLAEKRKEIAALASSASYRVGLVITWPMRKLWRTFRDIRKGIKGR